MGDQATLLVSSVNQQYILKNNQQPDSVNNDFGRMMFGGGDKKSVPKMDSLTESEKENS